MGTLALGIGANAALFAVVNAVLLRPLPYPDSDRIVVINHHAPGVNLPNLGQSDGTIALYQDLARGFSAVAMVYRTRVNLTGSEQPAHVRVLNATPSFFDVVAVEPSIGRRFHDGEVGPGRAPLALLMHATWQTRFGGRQDIIGQVVELDGHAAEIIGVMPPGFVYRDPETELILGVAVDRNAEFGSFGREGIARLAPGISLDAAASEVAALQMRIPERWSDFDAALRENSRWRASVRSLHDVLTEDIRTSLSVVLGAVGFVLLIACANVANLFLVRAESRVREISIRAALGASRARIARTVLYECLCVAVAGGVAGTALIRADGAHVPETPGRGSGLRPGPCADGRFELWAPPGSRRGRSVLPAGDRGNQRSAGRDPRGIHERPAASPERHRRFVPHRVDAEHR